MPTNILWRVFQQTSQGKFLFLMLALLFFLGIAPFLHDLIGIRIILDLFLSAVLLSAIYAVSSKRHQMITALALGLPMLAAIWLKTPFKYDWLFVIANVLTALFFGYIVVNLLYFIFRESRVSRDVIYAAIIVYLLMGIVWAEIFTLVNHFDADAFDISGFEINNSEAIFLYFSYVTLTTLGYGDISPLTSHAYSLAIIEAIIGQLYLTVLVARLVGLHISHSAEKNRDQEYLKPQTDDRDSEGEK